MLPLARIALLLLLCALPAARATNARFEASTTWAENINRASSPADWRDTWRHEARGALGLTHEWFTGFIATGELGAGLEHVHKFEKLSAASAGVSVTLRQKFGLGAFAPQLALDLGVLRRDTRLDFDDGWTTTAALRLVKRMTPTFRAALHGDWEQHYARSAIFDTNHHRAFATIAWDIFPWLQLSHGNGRLWGAFTANASATVWPRALGGALGSHISTYYNTIPWAATEAFGPRWISYRVDGRVSFYWFELSPALGRNTSLPLRYEDRVSINKVGVKYRQDFWTLSLLHRF